MHAQGASLSIERTLCHRQQQGWTLRASREVKEVQGQTLYPVTRTWTLEAGLVDMERAAAALWAPGGCHAQATHSPRAGGRPRGSHMQKGGYRPPHVSHTRELLRKSILNVLTTKQKQ